MDRRFQRREQNVLDSSPVWRRVDLRDIHDKTIGHHTATSNKFDKAIGNRFVTKLQIENAPFIGGKRSEARAQLFIVIVVPLLKVVGRKKHSLVP